MSKTDKTAPYWVTVQRKGHVYHDHTRGQECDFDQFDKRKPWKTHCGMELGINYQRQNKVFGRAERAHHIENMLERQNRRAWKNALATQDPDNISIGRLDSAWMID